MWDLPNWAVRTPTPPPDSPKATVLPLLSGKIVAEEARPTPGRIVSLVGWLSGKGFYVLRWFFATVLARIGRWMGLAAKVLYWGVLGWAYLFLLFIPELCSTVINAGCWVAYQLAYLILRIAVRVYILAMYLGAASRFVRDIAPIHGIFEY